MYGPLTINSQQIEEKIQHYGPLKMVECHAKDVIVSGSLKLESSHAESLKIHGKLNIKNNSTIHKDIDVKGLLEIHDSEVIGEIHAYASKIIFENSMAKDIHMKHDKHLGEVIVELRGSSIINGNIDFKEAGKVYVYDGAKHNGEVINGEIFQIANSNL